MSMPEKKAVGRMAEVIRKAIGDKQMLHCLSVEELSTVLDDAVNSLTASDIRGFIYRCVTNNEVPKGLLMAERAIEHALKIHDIGNQEGFLEFVGAAVGTLSMMSANMPEIKEKISSLLEHPHPEIVVSVIENLGHTSNLDNFNRVAELLAQGDSAIASAAAGYIEACTRDAAFRKRREFHVIESSAEEFLRNALLRLERVYILLRSDPGKPEILTRRLAILVAMIYNEVLDSTDWRRFKREEVDERIYCALENHLFEDIGPDATPYLISLLSEIDIENGTKRSALHTLGRLSKNVVFRRRICDFLSDFVDTERSEVLVSLANAILASCRENKPFSLLMCLPASEMSLKSIIPRSAGAPLKKSGDVD